MAIGLNLPRADMGRRDLAAPLRHVDWILYLLVVAMSVFGAVMIYSATKGPDTADTYFFFRQVLFVVLGTGIMSAVALLDYRVLRDFAWPIYGVAVFLLLAVLSPLGSESKGAQAWFSLAGFQLQPSELTKLAVIIALAALLESFRGEVSLTRLGQALAVVGAPMLLILLQNDLGTMLVFAAITMGMLLVGGVRGRHIALLAVAALTLTVGVLTSDVLADYQKARLTTFIDPGGSSGDDPGTAADTFNVRQAQTAIANGGVAGQGLFEGQQTQLAFVPEQQTDFIFTVPAEELGFVGAATVLALYGVIVWRIWRTAQLARDTFGTLLCVGVLSMFVFQLFQNAGMAMGIMPVTGLPLPFMSYGGSSTLASFAAMGLVLSVHMHRFR
jgi:rod shape determining protein RodA